MKITDDINLKFQESKKEDEVNYVFIMSNGMVERQISAKIPSLLTAQMQVVKYIADLKDWYIYKPEIKREKTENELIPELKREYESFISEKLRQIKKREATKKRNDKLRLESGKLFYEGIEEPLIYIGSIVDWFTAGERVNIMLAFITYCSQVINHTPISLIPLGEAGSGKTHIQQTALKLIPEEYVVYEKNITPAALFRRAEEDPYFYDRKIVNYGDMGGNNDQEFMAVSKNLMKELQSEGYLNKPLMVGSGGDFEMKELELIGAPCLTYTTVPNYVFDDQELSRSMLITPRVDNQDEFNARERIIGLHGKSVNYSKKMVELQETIQNMVRYLKTLNDDLIIINPYSEIIQKVLSSTPHYKRDFYKYDSILKTISMWNYKNKTLEYYDDAKFIYTDVNDVQLFLSLLDDYFANVNANLSPHAAKILDELKNLSSPLVMDETRGFSTLDVQNGWTINEYRKRSTLRLSKRSYQLYFKELNEKGFLEVVDTKNRAYVYEVIHSNSLQNVCVDDISLSSEMKEKIKSEVGGHVCDMLESVKLKSDLNIRNQHPLIKKPDWEVLK